MALRPRKEARRSWDVEVKVGSRELKRFVIEVVAKRLALSITISQYVFLEQNNNRRERKLFTTTPALLGWLSYGITSTRLERQIQMFT